MPRVASSRDEGTPPGRGAVEFVRLTNVPLAAVTALLNNRRMHRHMPLAGESSEQAAADWVAAKDAQWAENGYGPWALLVDGRFAGWGGFQRETDGADYALVLDPAYWGLGAAITRQALDRAFGELDLDEVTIALPHSRNSGRVLARVGFQPDGEVTYATTTFRRYRLRRETWRLMVG